jgi:hypothetical protein
MEIKKKGAGAKSVFVLPGGDGEMKNGNQEEVKNGNQKEGRSRGAKPPEHEMRAG